MNGSLIFLAQNLRNLIKSGELQVPATQISTGMTEVNVLQTEHIAPRSSSRCQSVSAKPQVVAIIPALNEADAIGEVVASARRQRTRDNDPTFWRIVVVDNGSIDDTAAVALAAGAVVVCEPDRGYGAACLRGLDEIEDSDVVVFIEGDASTPIDEVYRLINAIRAGADLVIGVRVRGRETGMTLPQRIGNALGCAMIRQIWGTSTRDLGPFRAVTCDALQQIDMQDRSYGWTVEMQVRAIQLGMRVDEVSTSVLPRIGHSKISGTVRGVIGAAYGIFKTIIKLWWSGVLRPGSHQSARPN